VTHSVEADPASARLGAHVRRLRGARGLTLVQLAEATDLSHPFLSQCERGLASFSLASLRRIAVALGTSPVELIAAADEEPQPGLPPIEIHAGAARSGAAAGFAEGAARALVSGRRPFVPLEFVGDNRAPAEYFQHVEHEFVYVLEGNVHVDLNGEVTRLAPGESAYYAGGVAHRWWSPEGRFKLLVVKQSPRA
jgi:transcriptional regulator with XRE-family HTH domain